MTWSPRHLHGFIRRGDREVDEAAHFLDFFFLDEIERIEVADFAGDLAGEGGGIEGGDAADAALARRQSLPDFGGGVADGAEQADAGDDDPSPSGYSPDYSRGRSPNYLPALACLPM